MSELSPQLIFQLIGMIAAGLIAYYTAENRSNINDAKIEGKVEHLQASVIELEQWRNLVTQNRFTNAHGQALREELLARLHNLPDSREVERRITRLEILLEAIQKKGLQ